MEQQGTRRGEDVLSLLSVGASEVGRNGRTDGTVALTEGIRARGGCSSAKGNALVPPPVSRPPRQDPVKPCTTRQNRGVAGPRILAVVLPGWQSLSGQKASPTTSHHNTIFGQRAAQDAMMQASQHDTRFDVRAPKPSRKQRFQLRFLATAGRALELPSKFNMTSS